MNGWLKEQQILNSEQEETIVMFHGFIGSPFDFKPLVDVLEKQNYRLVLPFLPAPMGNGENTLNAARAVIDRYKPSILIGFSMGGALSILLSDTVSKVILLAPYLGLPTGNQIATKGASLVHKMIPRIPKLSSGRIASKEGRVRYEPRGYSFETHSYRVAKTRRTGAIEGLRGSMFMGSRPQRSRCFLQESTKKTHVSFRASFASRRTPCSLIRQWACGAHRADPVVFVIVRTGFQSTISMRMGFHDITDG